MKVQPLGEEAYLIRDIGKADPFDFSKRISGFPGVIEAVSAYDTVAAYVDPYKFILDDFVRFAQDFSIESQSDNFKVHGIPLCYEMGIDFEDICQIFDLSSSELIRLHSSIDYRCHAIGFSPGFPYLGYLPDELTGLSRLPSPRVRVPSGSVGITGRQTGIYSQETPGGWYLIGRTPLSIVNVEDAYFPISAGDRIRFLPISASQFSALEGQRL